MKCPKCGYIPEEEKKEMELIQKIMSLGFQGKHEEAEKLAEKLGGGSFEIKDKDIKNLKRILDLIKANKKEDAEKLIKDLKKKNYKVKVSGV